MLHTEFLGHGSIGSGAEDILRFFTIYGHGSHVCHVSQLICINLHFLFFFKVVISCKYKNLNKITKI